jgi:hypothetical protein
LFKICRSLMIRTNVFDFLFCARNHLFCCIILLSLDPMWRFDHEARLTNRMYVFFLRLSYAGTLLWSV